jgi:hypothetical protein
VLFILLGNLGFLLQRRAARAREASP